MSAFSDPKLDWWEHKLIYQTNFLPRHKEQGLKKFCAAVCTVAFVMLPVQRIKLSGDELDGPVAAST